MRRVLPLRAKHRRALAELIFSPTAKQAKAWLSLFGIVQEDAIANEQSGYYQEQLNKFKDVFAAPPVREGYEVSFQD